ncbi:hypothetical protein EBU95_13145 [bacterium]|nr:hypothetical protein [bacterium]
MRGSRAYRRKPSSRGGETPLRNPSKRKSPKSVKRKSPKSSKRKPSKRKSVKRKSAKRKSAKRESSKRKTKADKVKECRGRKIGLVMHEFKNKRLKLKNGSVVTNPKQAIAIALSEANKYC